jgi:hypothetical protein
VCRAGFTPSPIEHTQGSQDYIRVAGDSSIQSLNHHTEYVMLPNNDPKSSVNLFVDEFSNDRRCLNLHGCFAAQYEQL